MNFNNVDQIISHYEEIKANAGKWRSLFEAAYLYSQPNRNPYTYTDGQEKGAEVYDTTLVKARQQFSSKMQAYITPIGKIWGHMVAGSMVPEQLQHDVNVQLAEITKIIFKYIHQSNFDVAVSESYEDLALGTAAIICNEGSDDNPLKFSSVQLNDYIPEEGADGTIENKWRQWDDISMDDILYTWPDAKVTQSMTDKNRDDKAKFNLLEADILDEATGMYNYKVINLEEKVIIVERQEESSAWIIGRWSNVSGEHSYGRGPVLDALPNALTLNKIYDFELRIGALASAPPWLAYSDHVFNPYNLQIEPNSILVVDQFAPGGEPIRPLAVGGDLQFTQLQVSDLRKQINDLMFVTPLPPLDKPGETATLTNYRMQSFAEEIGSAYGRLQVEFLNKIMQRVLYILRKKGLVPNIQIDNKFIDIKYISVLSDTQDMLDIQNFVQFFNTLQQTVGPQMALLGIQADKLPVWLAKKYKVDPNLIVDAEQLRQYQKQLSGAMQAQAQTPQPGQSQPSAQIPSAIPTGASQ